MSGEPREDHRSELMAAWEDRDAARAETARYRAALGSIKQIHKPDGYGPGPSYGCITCGYESGWPCATALIVLGARREICEHGFAAAHDWVEIAFGRRAEHSCPGPLRAREEQPAGDGEAS